MRIKAKSEKRGVVLLAFEEGSTAAFSQLIAGRFNIGDEVTQSAFDENSPFAQSYALSKSLAYLKNARTESQVSKYLEKLGILEPEKSITLQRLKEQRYIDDTGYAELFRLTRTEQGMSQSEISSRLSKRGIPSEISQQPTQGADRQSLLRFIERQINAAKSVPPEALKKAIYSKAMSKRFSSDDIAWAISHTQFPNEGPYESWYKPRIEKKMNSYIKKGMQKEQAARNTFFELSIYGISRDEFDEILYSLNSE